MARLRFIITRKVVPWPNSVCRWNFGVSLNNRVLVIDDDPVFTQVLARSLRKRGLEVEQSHNSRQALQLVRDFQPDRVTLDLKMINESGLQLLPELLKLNPALNIVVLTGYSSIATAVQAMKLGASNYLCKPANAEDILAAFSAQAAADIDVADNPVSVNRLEWEHIQKVLAENDGNVSATARALGMHRRTLQRKLSKRPVQR
ncbi:MAG: response regulator [Pseudomonadales bacterium]|nr:response regulator [Pseudomonadales bacterium]MCP5214078.1 response regulator [Pseudomonadales bacterium]MCP5302717.1 response regulator [Pseudomonadales bacterium]